MAAEQSLITEGKLIEGTTLSCNGVEICRTLDFTFENCFICKSCP